MLGKNLTSIVGKIGNVFKDILPSQAMMGVTLAKLSRKFRDFIGCFNSNRNGIRYN